MCSYVFMLLYVLLLTIWLCVSSDLVPPYGVVDIIFPGDTTRTVFSQPATFGPGLSLHKTEPMHVVVADDLYNLGCQPLSESPNMDFILFAFRGNCTFMQKAFYAEQAGASALIVSDGPMGYYWSGSPIPFSPLTLVSTPCGLDCSAGTGSVLVSKLSVSFIARGLQGYCGKPDDLCMLSDTGNRKNRTVCVLPEALTIMNADSTELDINIPSVFITAKDGNSLLTFLGTAISPSISIGARPTPIFEPSLLILWALSCFCALYGSYSSLSRPNTSTKHDNDEEIMNVESGIVVVSASVPVIISYIFLVSGVLTGMYFLVKFNDLIAVYLMMGVFSLAALAAVSRIVFSPLIIKLSRYFPRSIPYLPFTFSSCLCFNSVSISLFELFSVLLSAGLVLASVFTRKMAYSFILQDLLCACLCLATMRWIQLGSLRTCTYMLVTFFLYDIFVVYVAPIALGNNAMADFTSAGQPHLTLISSCYCRFNPSDVNCGPGEVVPMIFRIPRIIDWRGGYSILGIGDVIFPGLLLTLCARLDLSLRYENYLTHLRPASYSYFTVAAVGYCVGLASTLISLAVTRESQSALLFLIPCTLVPVLILAKYNGHLGSFWYSTDDSSSDEESDTKGLLLSD